MINRLSLKEGRNMKKWTNKLEKGQVMVILTVGIVALLAVTALAVDMGQYYSDRRHDQNAADDAALAGASKAGDVMSANGISIYNFSCDNPYVLEAMSEAEDAAILQAADNNFPDLVHNLDTQHGVEVTCPVGAKYLEVRVNVSSDVKTSFAQLLSINVLNNTVEAVTIVEPGSGLGEGMAIVALEKDGCGGTDGGLFFGGNSPDPEVAKVTIHNSGAHSNSCLICEGSSVTLQSDSPLELVSDDDTKCEAVNLKGGTTIKKTDDIIEPHQPDVKCGSGELPEPKFQHVNEITLEPGNYSALTVGNGQTLILKPGLYCVSGTIKVTNGVIKVAESAADPDKDDGVTIYGRDTIDINGGEVNLRAPRSKWISTKPASFGYARPTVPGLLFYLDPTSSNATLTLNGNAGTIFRGTVYYPTGEIKINGNESSAQWLVELIGNEITMSGNANINITYNGDNGHAGYPYISFQQ